MKNDTLKTLSMLGIFGIAMAFLETMIVVYLRKIYYPLGFSFPLRGFLEPNILTLEIVREFFTLVMLFCVAYLAGKNFSQRFAYFWYSFAIWDIFYYFWLKVILGWPSSLMTWDVLFLIPWTWAAPVLVPVICSFTMIFLAWVVLTADEIGIKKTLGKKEWILLVLGGLVQLYTYLIDYGRIIFSHGYWMRFFTLSRDAGFQEIIGSYIPLSYNWILFLIGEALFVWAIVRIWKKKK